MSDLHARAAQLLQQITEAKYCAFLGNPKAPNIVALVEAALREVEWATWEQAAKDIGTLKSKFAQSDVQDRIYNHCAQWCEEQAAGGEER